MNEALRNQIEARYGFRLPSEYCLLESREFLTLSGPAHASAFSAPGSYLWLNDMEWYSPQEIADFQFESYQMPGFVPFAFTGGGDYWCWQPESTDERGTPVVLCHHDYELATIYAPNFTTALYRQMLAFCRTDDPDLDAAAFLRRWAGDLAPVFPATWCDHLQVLSAAADRLTLATAFERDDLVYEHFDAEIRWMQPAA